MKTNTLAKFIAGAALMSTLNSCDLIKDKIDEKLKSTEQTETPQTNLYHLTDAEQAEVDSLRDATAEDFETLKYAFSKLIDVEAEHTQKNFITTPILAKANKEGDHYMAEKILHEQILQDNVPEALEKGNFIQAKVNFLEKHSFQVGVLTDDEWERRITLVKIFDNKIGVISSWKAEIPKYVYPKYE